ncbi:MAG TPA: hypothetical protein VHJ78_03915 [Actinomycetota bacterium]|nr:hypothetical protein [Actinomycetota bacterium]
MDGSRDWRLSGQEKYLFGATLIPSDYTRDRVLIDSPWENDQCEFCRAEFLKENFPDVLHHGYRTANGLHWICSDCFRDFHAMFLWKVASHPDAPTR